MGGEPPIPIGCSAIKPIERHGLEAISWFFYDKNTGAIMGRTPLSWLLITIFYIIYYAFLVGFWALMLFVFFQTIDDKSPKWQITDGLIGKSPALGVRPGQDDDLMDSSIIMFRKDIAEAKEGALVPGYESWAKKTTTFLKKYSETNRFAVDCANGKPADMTDEQFCKFNTNILDKCKSGNFGYNTGEPCILLKLNRIFGLEPTYYNNTAKLPEEMPDLAKKRITNEDTKNKNQIWVHCQGENPADKENMGAIEYFPKDGGFPDLHFPFINQYNYTSPLVAVKFSKLTVGQLYHIQCRAWAGNIKYNKRDRIGIAHLEIMVHDATSAERVEKGSYP